MDVLSPGTYEGLVVDVDELDDDAIAIEVALTTGARKGDTVRVRGPRARRDALELLGLPVSLVVTDEGIRVAFD
jgi:hypothetical protein